MDDDLVNVVEPGLLQRWGRQAERLRREARIFYFAFKHPRVRWYARLVAACTAGYLVSPIQLIPSFIPVIGFLDDLLVLFLGVTLLKKLIPVDVLTKCRELAEKADTQRKEVRSAASIVVFAAIVCLWLLAAVTASALVASYIAS